MLELPITLDNKSDSQKRALFEIAQQQFALSETTDF